MARYIVKLTQEEREALRALVNKGKGSARTLTHARILLATDEGEHNTEERQDYEQIAQTLLVSRKTIERVRQRLVEEGIASALHRLPHTRTKPRRLTGDEEAHLVVLACSDPPTGRARWTLTLLADQMVSLHIVDTVSPSTVRRTLKKMNLSHG